MFTFETDAGRAAGYLAAPPGGKAGPGVLVLHAWWGLTPVFTEYCDRLAAAGCVALAPDLYAGRTAETIEQAEALLKARDVDRMRATADAALGELRRHPAVARPKLGIVGFSMGAAWAADLAERHPEEVAAVVLYYGAVSADFAAARAEFLGHFGDPDEWEPLEGVRAMEAELRAAGRPVSLHLYPGAGHWFAEPNQPNYHPAAAEQAWTRTLAFLRAKLNPPVRAEPGSSNLRGDQARHARALGRPGSFIW